MSMVSTVTIQLTDYETEERALKELNEWVKANGHAGGFFETIDSEHSAGTKHPEVRLIWGGFNYLSTDEFIHFFRSLKIENALLTICSQSGRFTVVHSDE